MPIVCRHPKQIGAPCRICAGTTGDIDIFIKGDTMSASVSRIDYRPVCNDCDYRGGAYVNYHNATTEFERHRNKTGHTSFSIEQTRKDGAT